MSIQNIVQNSTEMLILVLVLIWAVNSGLMGGYQLSEQLACNSQYSIIKIGVDRFGKNSLLAIDLTVVTQNALPLAMTVFESMDQQYNRINRYQLYANSNNNMDIQAIERASDRQSLLYYMANSVPYLYIAVYRLSLQNIQYSTNLDRAIQYYIGPTNVRQISTCTVNIKYNINIYNRVSLLSAYAYYSELYAQNRIVKDISIYHNCQRGAYSQYRQGCQCDINYGMQHCDVRFQPIPAYYDRKINNIYIQTQNKHYYYYDSVVTQGRSQRLQIKLTKYTNTYQTRHRLYPTLHPQLNVLYLIQPISEQLRPPNLFNQYDPAQIHNITLHSGHRLVIAVYKPKWTQGQSYNIQLVSKLTTKYLAFVIAICGVCTCCLNIFVLYFCFRREDQTIGTVLATPIGRSSQFASFDIDKYFPDVNFRQFNEQLLTTKYEQQYCPIGCQEFACSICLDSFQIEGQLTVKMTTCCHIYHSSCLKQWINKQQSCPNCRTSFTLQIIQQVQRAAGIMAMKLSPIDRYIKIWKYVKKNTTNNGESVPTARSCDTNQDLLINNLKYLSSPRP